MLLWLAAFALTSICIGLELYHKKGNAAMEQHKNVRAWFCPECEMTYKHDILSCPDCHETLERLEFFSEHDLNTHIMQVEFEQEERGLSVQMPGVYLTKAQVKIILQIEQDNDCLLSSRSRAIIPMPSRTQEQASLQASRDFTLPISEHNIFLRWEREKWRQLPEEER